MKNIETWEQRLARMSNFDPKEYEENRAACKLAEIAELRAKLYALEKREPVDLVLTFNCGELVKAVFQDQTLYEVDLSPKPYFQVCWANAWGGAYESEEVAMAECISLCGYGRSIREVKPGDAEYKNPHYLNLVEKHIHYTPNTIS